MVAFKNKKIALLFKMQFNILGITKIKLVIYFN